MMPVLEGFGHVQTLSALSDLHKLTNELLVVCKILLDRLEAGSHDFELPLSCQLGRSFPHVFGDLSSLEPLSDGLSLVEVLDILL